MRPLLALLCPLVAATPALAQAPAATAPAREPPLHVTVAVDLSGLSKETAERIDALNLETRTLLRLVQDQFAVVSPAANPDVQVRAEDAEGGVRLIATGAGGADEEIVPLSSGSRAELQLEIAHRVVALVRSREAAVLAARKAAAEAAAAKKQEEPRAALIPLPQPPVEAPGPPPPEPIFFDVVVGAAALWQGGVPDALYTVRVGVFGSGPLGIDLRAGFSHSTGLDLLPPAGPDVIVREWELQAGPRVRLFAAGPLRGEASVLAGVIIHHFTRTFPASLDPPNPRLYLLASLPLDLRYRVGWFSVGARLAPGVAFSASGLPRSHGAEYNRQEVKPWRREPVRLESGGFIQATF